MHRRLDGRGAGGLPRVSGGVMKNFYRFRAAHDQFEKALEELEDRIDELEDKATKWEWTAVALAQMLSKFTHQDTWQIIDEVMSLAEKETTSVLDAQEVAAEAAG